MRTAVLAAEEPTEGRKHTHEDNVLEALHPWLRIRGVSATASRLRGAFRLGPPHFHQVRPQTDSAGTALQQARRDGVLVALRRQQQPRPPGPRAPQTLAPGVGAPRPSLKRPRKGRPGLRRGDPGELPARPAAPAPLTCGRPRAGAAALSPLRPPRWSWSPSPAASGRRRLAARSLPPPPPPPPALMRDPRFAHRRPRPGTRTPRPHHSPSRGPAARFRRCLSTPGAAGPAWRGWAASCYERGPEEEPREAPPPAAVSARRVGRGRRRNVHAERIVDGRLDRLLQTLRKRRRRRMAAATWASAPTGSGTVTSRAVSVLKIPCPYASHNW
ncbi:basic proline-rich protein-like [Myotis daubentonii]|uniref:basic proline-rich protein-like n=1 Tax=Myotis daubentonii TaxID=98922 RepID=UPI002873A8E0|nr:basic proline-rich protein-like [Myotis daubentonii]